MDVLENTCKQQYEEVNSIIILFKSGNTIEDILRKKEYREYTWTMLDFIYRTSKKQSNILYSWFNVIPYYVNVLKYEPEQIINDQIKTLKNFDKSFIIHMLYKILLNNVTQISNDQLYKENLCEHQYDNMIKTCEYFNSGKTKGIWNLFCRYGKTRLSCLFCHKMDYKKILILVPSIYLVEQTFKEWTKFFDNSNIIKISCKEDYDIKIKEIYKQSQFIIICVYNSSKVVEDIKFDICIFDEAHRTAINNTLDDISDDSNEFIDNTYNQLLLNSEIISRKLFLTATLKDTSGVYSMNNKNIYGDIIIKVSALEAKKIKRLSDYKLLCITINDNINSGDKIIIEDCVNFIKCSINNSKIKNINILVCEYLHIAKSLLETIKKYNINHVITFHKYIYRCQIFKYIIDSLNKTKKYCDYISGNDDIKTRTIKLENFQTNERTILCSAKVLQEGVDIPHCDAVCFVDTKTSVVDTIQSLSRCLTYNENKHMAYIILPFFKDSTIKDDIRTNDLRIIIKNLIECDENVKEYFDTLKNKSKIEKKENSKIYEQPDILQTNLNNIVVDYDAQIIEQLNSISYDTYLQAHKKVYKKYKSIKEYRENIIKDYDNDIPLFPENIYKRLGWNGWKEYIGTDIENCEKKKEKIKKCRDITKCVKNGQRIRHCIKNKDKTQDIKRICIYNNGIITCIDDNGEKVNIQYDTLNKMAENTYKKYRPDRCVDVNAWTNCEIEVDGKWISMDNLPILE